MLLSNYFHKTWTLYTKDCGRNARTFEKPCVFPRIYNIKCFNRELFKCGYKILCVNKCIMKLAEIRVQAWGML